MQAPLVIARYFSLLFNFDRTQFQSHPAQSAPPNSRAFSEHCGKIPPWAVNRRWKNKGKAGHSPQIPPWNMWNKRGGPRPHAFRAKCAITAKTPTTATTTTTCTIPSPLSPIIRPLPTTHSNQAISRSRLSATLHRTYSPHSLKINLAPTTATTVTTPITPTETNTPNHRSPLSPIIPNPLPPPSIRPRIYFPSKRTLAASPYSELIYVSASAGSNSIR